MGSMDNIYLCLKRRPVFIKLFVLLICLYVAYPWIKLSEKDLQQVKEKRENTLLKQSQTNKPRLQPDGPNLHQTRPHLQSNNAQLQLQKQKLQINTSKWQRNDLNLQPIVSQAKPNISLIQTMLKQARALPSSSQIYRQPAHLNATNLYKHIQQTGDQTPLHITPYDVMQTPFYDVMHLDMDDIEYVPGFKNPCFFARTTKEKCEDYDVDCGNVALQCLPYFFIAGVAKCGTTDMFMRLVKHQETRFAEKEICWWNKQGKMDYLHMETKNVTLRRYAQKFSWLSSLMRHHGDLASSAITVDACPTYFKLDDYWELDSFNQFSSNGQTDIEGKYMMPHKIHHLLPNAKLIFMLREPKSKLLSQFRMKSANLRLEATPGRFHSLVAKEIAWFHACIATQSFDKCMYRNRCIFHIEGFGEKCVTDVVPALYSVYIEKWLEVFPRENLLFVKFEDYTKDPRAYIEKHVLPFLGLSPFSNEAINDLENGIKVYNKGKNEFEMNVETETLLDEFLTPYNKRLVELLGSDFQW